MQIAGNKCKVCERDIILSTEGKFCGRCGTFAHLACAPQENCDVCGQAFERYEPMKPDPLTEAILPRSLRPSRSGGPMLAAGLILVFAILVLIVYYSFIQMWGGGH